jgi:protein SCO1/2
MKSCVVIFLMLFCSQLLYAADSVQKSEKGLFTLELATSGKNLKNGVNSLDITVRDKGGKNIEGADLTVTPWFPAMGHGVWDKPVVTASGAGKYRVQNIVTSMDGRWELKIHVKKGALQDVAVFSFDVSAKEQGARKDSELPKGKYTRSIQYYTVPNVTLLNQDGKKVNFRELVDSGKPVIIDFIFTTCTTICPVLSVSFTSLRKELGADADKVQLISISIDPEHDRPEQMKKYLSRFKAGKGWDFLTGSRENIDRVLSSLGASIIDKMSHEPLYIIKAPHSDDWVRIKGLLNKGELLSELRRLEHK